MAASEHLCSCQRLGCAGRAVNTTVPCVNGVQQWQGLYYPGIITPHPTGTEDYSMRGKFRVPVNFHIGNMILAAATNYTVDSVPPSKFGGNSWCFIHGPALIGMHCDAIDGLAWLNMHLSSHFPLRPCHLMRNREARVHGRFMQTSDREY